MLCDLQCCAHGDCGYRNRAFSRVGDIVLCAMLRVGGLDPPSNFLFVLVDSAASPVEMCCRLRLGGRGVVAISGEMRGEIRV